MLCYSIEGKQSVWIDGACHAAILSNKPHIGYWLCGIKIARTFVVVYDANEEVRSEFFLAKMRLPFIP